MPHTPGPWTIHGWGEDNYEVNADDETVCNVPGFDDETVDSDRAEANARLIAAAPELLAACRSLVDEIDSWVWVNVGGKVRAFEVSGGYAAYLQNLVRAAIAKAEGRADDQ